MNVYIKNWAGQQTVRYFPIYKALWLRLYAFIHYTKEERPTIKFVI